MEDHLCQQATFPEESSGKLREEARMTAGPGGLCPSDPAWRWAGHSFEMSWLGLLSGLRKQKERSLVPALHHSLFFSMFRAVL